MSTAHRVAAVVVAGAIALTLTSINTGCAAIIAEAEPGAELESGAPTSRPELPNETNDGWQEAFTAAATIIKESYPQHYASGAITEPGVGWIGFAGTAPAEARSMISDLSGVTIRENLGYSDRELQETIRSMVDLVSSSIDGATQVVGYTDGTDPTVQILYHLDAASQPPDSAQLEQLHQSLQSVVATIPGFDVTIDAAGGGLVDLEAQDGGESGDAS